MIIANWHYFLLFTSAFTLVGILTPFMRRFAISNGILDYPNYQHKSHQIPVPYLGGIAIILSTLIVTYSALIISDLSFSSFWLATSLILPALGMGLIGLWDDIKSLHPFPRFIGQTLAGMVVATILILTNNVGNPTGSKFVDAIISVLWIVGICNSINFFDNLDGGAAGTITLSAFTIFYLAIANSQFQIGAFAIVLAGSTLSFLFWNKTPARIYMGDAGALFLGILIASLTIRLKPNTDSIIGSFATPIFILAIPILDTSVAVISRLLRKISPFKGGKDHLSHRLIRAGFTRKTSAIILWLLSLFFNLLAILLTFINWSGEVTLVIFAFCIWILLFFKFINTSDT